MIDVALVGYSLPPGLPPEPTSKAERSELRALAARCVEARLNDGRLHRAFLATEYGPPHPLLYGVPMPRLRPRGQAPLEWRTEPEQAAWASELVAELLRLHPGARLLVEVHDWNDRLHLIQRFAPACWRVARAGCTRKQARRRLAEYRREAIRLGLPER